MENEKTVLVFNGGGFKTAMFIGMLKAVREAGISPEYIIGTCGGSAATAIAHSFRTSEEQINFIKSRESFEYINSIKETKYFNLNQSIFMIKDLYLKFKKKGVIPNIFDHYLLELKQDVPLGSLHTTFTPQEHKSIIIAAEAIYDESYHGKIREDKLFQQVFFTDAETGKILEGEVSPSYQDGKTSIMKETKVISHASLAQASRASVTDPFFINPAVFENRKFFTGAVDLYPVELAKKLGSKVIMCLPDKFSTLERGLIWASYHYDQNERYDQVFTDIDVDYLIDVRDFPDEYKFIPVVNWLQWKIITRIPRNYDKYVQIVEGQFQYGYEKMKETLKTRK